MKICVFGAGAIGCVVDPACEVVAPGVIEHHLFKRFTIGEPDGSRPERVAALGVRIPEEMMERRFDAAGSVSGHKISMLQDLERGRSLEIDALVTAVRDLGRLAGVPTPGIEVVLALVQERGRQAGLYGEGSRA